MEAFPENNDLLINRKSCSFHILRKALLEAIREIFQH